MPPDCFFIFSTILLPPLFLTAVMGLLIRRDYGRQYLPPAPSADNCKILSSDSMAYFYIIIPVIMVFYLHNMLRRTGNRGCKQALDFSNGGSYAKESKCFPLGFYLKVHCLVCHRMPKRKPLCAESHMGDLQPF